MQFRFVMQRFMSNATITSAATKHVLVNLLSAVARKHSDSITFAEELVFQRDLAPRMFLS